VRAQAAQLGPPVGDGAVGAGPRARGRGRLTASGGRLMGGGANRPGSGMRSPVRLPSAIGEGKGCTVIVMERRTLRANPIEL
jgi:hypothetical protein